MAQKVANRKLKLRPADFPTGKCGICTYFQSPKSCKVIVGPVNKDLVCNAYQGGKNFISYKVNDFESFNKGMIAEQPYEHKVIDAYDTPVGWLVIIQDTMKPKPHVFSLPAKFHIEHTSREHHWTQKEVDRLVKVGKGETRTIKSKTSHYKED